MIPKPPFPGPGATGALPAQEQLAFTPPGEEASPVSWVDIRYEQPRSALEDQLAEVPGLHLPPAPPPPPPEPLRPGVGENLRSFLEAHADLLLAANRAYAERHGLPESEAVGVPPPETIQRRFEHGHDPEQTEVTYRTDAQTLWVELVPGTPGHRFVWENGTVVDLPGRPAQVRSWSLRETP